MDTRNWWKPLTFILIVSLIGVGVIGFQTYVDAPPVAKFRDNTGKLVFDKTRVEQGQEVFHRYALMEYGSYFGDGAQRGPDFTAEALHLIQLQMVKFYTTQLERLHGRLVEEVEAKQIEERVKLELKRNTFNPEKNEVLLNSAQVYAFYQLQKHYLDLFLNKSVSYQGFPPKDYITSETEIQDLAAFFYWGAWVCVVERPGETFSYTHNWPYDPSAGNTPTAPVILWSVFGILAFVLVCGIVLYYIGQYNQVPNKYFNPPARALFTSKRVQAFKPLPSQKATFKFFLVAVLLFLVQVCSGLVTINDFINWMGFLGIDLSAVPVTIPRSWHLMLALYWISTCWIASSIFILPILSKQEIKGQKTLINVLFWLLFVMVVGSLGGMVLGPLNLLGEWWYWLGHQGWEFVDFGKLYQIILMLVFVLWMIIVYRGLKPCFIKKQSWSLPKWILYAVIGIPLLFLSGFVAKPETNFVIADFWRWMVIHMWVEAFFEVFITVIVSYLMVLMGLVSQQAAIRVVYFATLLFLGTGLLGISHNFYWNAKPVATMALGSIFSTLQFVPLILLTVEAWRFKNMPALVVGEVNQKSLGRDFGFGEVFLFLVAVNFWNFFGAGVLGIIINLPIMNYFEHGTYLTVNHAHAAMMGVYGNISLAAMLFATRLMFSPETWNTTWIKISFWGINLGLMLMVLLDLFPAGSIQFKAVVEKGLWYGRSREFIDRGVFHSLTWMRGIGATVFFFIGVVPLCVFMLRGVACLKTCARNVADMDDQQQ